MTRPLTSYDLLITNGTCALTTKDGSIRMEKTNIGVKNGKIQDLGLSANTSAKEVIDAKGLDHRIHSYMYGITIQFFDTHIPCITNCVRCRRSSKLRSERVVEPRVCAAEESPPTIVHHVPTGSVQPAADGRLVVYPGSIVHLDCLFLRTRGNPSWRWSSGARTYPAG